MSRAKMPVAVHLLLIKDEEILLLRRYNTGYEDGAEKAMMKEWIISF